MKKIFFILPVAALLLTATSCFKDNSNLNYEEISDIGISGISDRYSLLSYAGQKLEISPAIATLYSDMEYGWYLIDPRQGSGSAEQPAELIARTKELSYDINLPEGAYTLVFKATSKSNGYSAIRRSTLAVSMEFSRGFYVIKENAEGNTDLDFFTPDDELRDNLLTKMHGQSMQGAPRSLSVCYGQSYMQELRRNYANSICIVTEQNKIQFIRVSDMETMFDFSNMFYGTPDPDEVPYLATRGYFMTFYLSNKGMRGSYTNDMYASTGIFGMPQGGGGSTKLVMSAGTNGMVYWDETGGNLMESDYNAFVYPVESDPAKNYQTQALQDYRCITAGQNYIGETETILFLFQDATGNRMMYSVNTDQGSAVVQNVIPLNTGLHLAQADVVSVNGRSATLVYSVHNNKLYGYNFENGEEREIAFAGIPAGEEITYVSNRYWTHAADEGNLFDYLVIGTQSAHGYKIYMYEMIGGQPSGSPVKTLSGEGKMKSIRYISPVYQPRPMQSPLDFSRMD